MSTLTDHVKQAGVAFTDLWDLSRISRILMRRYIDIGPGKAKDQYMNSEVQYLGKAGKEFAYLESTTVIDTLNEAFSPLGWGSDCSQVLFQPVAADGVSRQIAVHCILEIYTPWGTVKKSGWGARSVNSVGEATGRDAKHEFGDDVKSAASDALKKAATQLSIFNYVYRFGTETMRSMPLQADVAPIAAKLGALSKARGWNKEQLLTFCSGIVHKTLFGAGDMNAIQTEACYSILKNLEGHPHPIDNIVAPAAAVVTAA